VQPHAQISVRRQCALLGVNRSTVYHKPRGESAENLELMRLLDEQYTCEPTWGTRRMVWWLNSEKGRSVNPKRVRRLMRLMGIEAIYAKPKLSARHAEHRVYPYLLRGVPIVGANQVWSTDITYVPMQRGFMYLMAIIDWYSRYVLAWRLSNNLEGTFCLEALEEALSGPVRPEIFNTDQGVQFTANAFTQCLRDHGVQISMDGRGRALDNIFIERLWRTVKYEYLYLHDFASGPELYHGVGGYFGRYNTARPHQALNYHKPADVYFGAAPAPTVKARP
jgi:putative transposase